MSFRGLIRMTTHTNAESLVQESDRELEQTVRAEARQADARAVLARLLSAFDNRRRAREALALWESARVPR